MSSELLFWEVLQPEYINLFNSRKIAINYSNESWRFKISFLPTNEPMDLEESKRILEILKIANYMCGLPDESLKNIAYSEDLRNLFEVKRTFNEHIAKYFVISCLNLEVPELSSQKLKVMNMRKSDDYLCSLRAEFYQALWNLVRNGFPYVGEMIKGFPFKADLALLFNILKQSEDDYFLMCASEYIRIDTNEMVQLLEGMKEESLKPDEAEKLLANPLVLQKSWLYEICSVLEEASQEDEQIAVLLGKVHKTWVEESDSRIYDLSKRHGKGKVFKSHEWRHGKKELLCKGRPPYKK